jgi:hypothetical protein
MRRQFGLGQGLEGSSDPEGAVLGRCCLRPGRGAGTCYACSCKIGNLESQCGVHTLTGREEVVATGNSSRTPKSASQQSNSMLYQLCCLGCS